MAASGCDAAFESFLKNLDGGVAAYIRQVKEAMDLFYPGWSTDTGYLNNQDTVCIPPSLDMENNTYIGPQDPIPPNYQSHSRNLIGRLGETQVLHAFQKLNGIGGFMISGLKFEKATKKNQRVKKKITNSPLFFKYLRELERSFETDNIFLHSMLGIIVLEAKAIKDNAPDAKIEEKYNKALEQVQYVKASLEKLCSLVLKDGEMTAIPIICLPNFPLEKLAVLLGKERLTQCKVLSKGHFATQASFQDFWKDELTKIGKQNLFESSPAFKALFILLCGLRSTANDFNTISQQHNVVQMYKALSEMRPAIFHHSSEKKGKQATRGLKMDPENDSQILFLTPQQIQILEDDYKDVIICGPPGTGKTLLVMQKALQWSREPRESRVVLSVRQTLVPFYQRFFEANKDQMVEGREPEVYEFGVGSMRESDDYLRDEDQMPDDQGAAFLARRAKDTGRTFLAFTGNITPWVLSHFANTLAEKYPEMTANYRIHRLQTVLRGTTQIIRYWNNELQLSHLKEGHSISGCAVDNKNQLLPNTGAVLKGILEKLNAILAGATESDKTNKNHVAVICNDLSECTAIKEFLAKNSIQGLSLEEYNFQSNGRTQVVVEENANTLSYEWETVIVVSLYNPMHYQPSFIPIAASRAICQLIMIGRDVMSVVNKIADKYCKQTNTSFTDFLRCVVEVSKEIGENDEEAMIFNLLYSSLRLNYIASEVRALNDEKLSKCLTLADYVKLITTDSHHLRAFCKYSWHVQQHLKRCAEVKSKALADPPRLSKFFKALLPCDLQEAVEELFPVYSAALTQLSIEQLELGRVQYSDRVNQLSDRLNACEGWRDCTMDCVDQILISAVTVDRVEHKIPVSQRLFSLLSSIKRQICVIQ